MVGSRWFGRAGPGVLAGAAVAVLATSALGAGPPAAHAWPGQPCRGPARAPAALAAPGTAWIRDWTAAARCTVRSSASGRPAARGAATLGLARESFAAGPFGATVLVGLGRRVAEPAVAAGRDRRLRLGRRHDGGCRPPGDAAPRTVAPSSRCASTAGRGRTSGSGDDRCAGGAAVRILAPIAADGRFGRTWSTEFAWQADGAGPGDPVVRRVGLSHPPAVPRRRCRPARRGSERSASSSAGSATGSSSAAPVAAGRARSSRSGWTTASRLVLDQAAGDAARPHRPRRLDPGHRRARRSPALRATRWHGPRRPRGRAARPAPARDPEPRRGRRDHAARLDRP